MIKHNGRNTQYNRGVQHNYLREADENVPEVLTREWVTANIPTDATHVDIPYGVTILGEDCFDGYESLKSITIPNSVKSLEGGCFYNCKSLTSITIPNSVKSIGNHCFEGCTHLKSITIPSGVLILGRGCFEYCKSLESITLPKCITRIEEFCFDDCGSLTDVYYGGSEADEDWIKIGVRNRSIRSATWHYNSRGVNEHINRRRNFSYRINESRNYYPRRNRYTR